MGGPVSRWKRLALGAACAALLGTFTGCGGGDGGGGDDDGGAGGGAGFDVELIMRSTNGAAVSNFAFGAPLAFNLTITNRSGGAQVLTLPTAQLYDLAVLPEGSATPRWRWSFNQTFTPATTQLTFAGHQTITYLYIWNGVLEDGTQIMPGRYDFRGTLAYAQYANDWQANHELAAPVRKITITD